MLENIMDQLQSGQITLNIVAICEDISMVEYLVACKVVSVSYLSNHENLYMM